MHYYNSYIYLPVYIKLSTPSVFAHFVASVVHTILQTVASNLPLKWNGVHLHARPQKQLATGLQMYWSQLWFVSEARKVARSKAPLLSYEETLVYLSEA